MTGRDLIVYILENNLENEQIFKDGKLIGFMTIDEVAAKNNVGKETVLTWIKLGQVKFIIIDGIMHIPASFKAKEETCVED